MAYGVSRSDCMASLPILHDDGGSADSDLLQSVDQKLESLGWNGDELRDAREQRKADTKKYGEVCPATSNAVEFMPGVLQVHSCLGIGTYSEVHLCTVRGATEAMAVKVMLGGTLEQSQEVRLLRELKHPHLVELWDVIEGPPHGIVMEHCSGGCLGDLVHNKPNDVHFKALALTARLQPAVEIASAIEYLHSGNIIHRDVKSGNSFLAHPFREDMQRIPPVKLGDLGFAREAGVCMTRAVGTVRFMAPEVIVTNRYGLAADIFSCGVLLYELISGEVPYGAWVRNHAAMAVAIVGGRRPDHGSANSWLDSSEKAQQVKALLDSCWAQSPGNRCSAQELVLQLRSLTGDERTAA